MKIKNVHGAPLLLLVITLVLIAVEFVDVSVLAAEDGGYLSMIVLQILIFGLPAVFYARLRGKKFLSHLRIRLAKVHDIPLLIYALGFMVSGGALICFFMYRFFPEAFASSSPAYAVSNNVGGNFVMGLYAVIAAAVVPAFVEEFLFRGVMIAEYERNGVAMGVIMSALTFSLAHFSFERMPVYFFNGIILALVLYATRSLLGAIIVHAANNVFALFFEVYIYRAAVRQGGGLVMFGFITACACLLFAVLFFGAAQKNYAELAERNVSSEHSVKKKRDSFPYAVEPFLSPAFIALVIASIVGAFIRRG